MSVSGPTTPGSPPPEVPEEFAAAYRAAYEQALNAQTGGAQHRDVPEPDDADDADDTGEIDDLPQRRGPIRIGTHRVEERDEVYYDDSPTWIQRITDSRWLVPFLLALLAMLLIFGAYVVGRNFARQVADGASNDSEPRVVITEGGGSDGEKQPVTNQKARKGSWDGKVRPVGKVVAKAGCTSKAGVDASGKKVSYGAGNLTDGAADTTWRCNGAAVGERITLTLARKLPIGEVGLIPGYAKTDEKSKVDRFAENNRITRVRWTIGGTEVVQSMSGAAKDRSLRLLRVPRTTTDTVTLEILAVKKGPRDTTAISEVQLGRAG